MTFDNHQSRETSCSPDLTNLNQRDQFHLHFQRQKTELLEQIHQLEESGTGCGLVPNTTDLILARIKNLSNKVADASDNISLYDRRIYSEGIKNLEEKLREARARKTSGSRFQFKSKYRRSSICSKDVGKLASNTPRDGSEHDAISPSSSASSNLTTVANNSTHPGEINDTTDLSLLSKNGDANLTTKNTGIRKLNFLQAEKVEIHDEQDVHLVILPRGSCKISTGCISKVRRSVIDLSFSLHLKTPFASITIRDVNYSFIVVGQVTRAAQITGVVNTIIVVAAGQVRIHESTNLKIYLYCSSRPIIEDCKNIQFSPLPNNFKTPSGDLTENQWDKVADFNWLKSEPSPNWSVIPEKERLDDGIWTDMALGQSGISSDELLQIGGLKF